MCLLDESMKGYELTFLILSHYYKRGKYNFHNPHKHIVIIYAL